MPAPGDQYGNVKNPFEEPRVDQFSAQEIATLQSRLNKQLGPEYISQRPGNGGGRVAYLEGNKAIALANEVFGFNGWSSSVGQVQIDYVDENASGKVSLGLSIVVRITLKCGTYHEDIGYGSIENGKGKAASFEKAKKEATTDGLKRALRTFGNVLGNCLYDKEYLKKVQTMKVRPIRFNEENLYRHADFAPPTKKEEETAVVKNEHRTPAKTNGILRTRTEHLNVSVGGEFDDEFDGNLFDGVELTENNSEDTTFDQSAPKALEAAKARGRNGATSRAASPVKNGGNPPRPPNQRVHTAPVQRGQNAVQQPHPPQNQQTNASGRPSAILQNSRAPQTPGQQQAVPRPDVNKQRPAPPTTVDIHAVPKPQNAQQQQQQQPQNQPLRPTPPQAQQPRPEATTTPDAHANARPPVGFVTSRAAILLQNSESSTPLNNLPAFNPRVDSPVPKAQRTPGVDYTKSIAVKRGEFGTSAPPPAPPNLAPTTNNGGALNRPGPAGPRGSTNFVNPQQDMNRRIGAPGGGMGMGTSPGVGRTTAYKVPSKRPALQDVSNQNQRSETEAGGEPDAKRQRFEALGSGNGMENVGPGVVES